MKEGSLSTKDKPLYKGKKGCVPSMSTISEVVTSDFSAAHFGSEGDGGNGGADVVASQAVGGVAYHQHGLPVHQLGMKVSTCTWNQRSKVDPLD